MTSQQKLELVGRPSLMLPPIFSAVEEEEGKVDKFEYEFYSPLKKTKNDDSLMADMVKEQDVIRFHSNGGQKELILMQDKDNKWVGSSHGWLVLFNKINRNMSLINPVSGRCILLPPFPNPPFRGEPVKVILSHSPDDEKCRALAIHARGYFIKAAAFCSPGRSSRWSPLAHGRGPRYYDIDFVYLASRRCFVSVKRVLTGWIGLGGTIDVLEFWDVESSTEAPVTTLRAPKVSSLDRPGPYWRTYLVSEEDSGRFFMVRRYLVNVNKRVFGYNVYGIERYVGSGEVLQLLSSLDDLVMFIGMNHGFAVKASRFPEFRPNCIYFSEIWKEGFRGAKLLADVYDYNGKKYSRLFHAKDFPFHHNLPWFTLTHDSKRLEDRLAS